MKNLSLKRLLFACALAVFCIFSSFAGSYDEQIVNRKNEGMWGDTYFYVYVISNISKEDVMPPICREALLRVDGKYPHCNYIALNSLGTYGKKQKDFLPYDATRRTETILVIDRSKLTDDEKLKLNLLIGSLYPLTPTIPKDRATVSIWVQNAGEYGKENQVIIDIPELSWLREAANDLWNMPYGLMKDRSKDTYKKMMPVNRLGLLTNQTNVTVNLEKFYKYTAITEYSLDDFDKFRDEKGLTHKFICIDWNGDTEFGATEAGQVLPPTLKTNCSQLTPDRMGITGWQRFCRQAIAQREKVDGVEVWTICAPTKKYFDALMNQVIRNSYAGGPYTIDLCDLTYMKTIAIGTIIDTPDVDRKRIVLQQRLEEVAAPILNIKVQSMVSTQNWGNLLDISLGKDAENDDPFRRPEDKKNVNQASNADGVLLLWAKTLQPEVRYDFPRTRLTAPFPAFTIAEPKAPSEPDPNNKPLFGPHTYPGNNSEERRASEKFQNDYTHWKYEDMPQYEKNLREWKSKKVQWENERDSYTVNYEYSVQTMPAVSLTGFLRVLDMAGNQNIIWSREVALKKQGDSRVIRRIPVTVRGDRTDPSQPEEMRNYTNVNSWSECTKLAGVDTVYSVGQDVLVSGMREGIMKIADSALWANDLKPWNRAKTMTTTRK
ncbi:MAG: hypothetical protein WCO98_15275 [bacterium]